MKTLVTSCGRPDLLMRTLNSLVQDCPESLEICLCEDKVGEIGYDIDAVWSAFKLQSVIQTAGKGQHGAIECFLDSVDRNEYGGKFRKSKRSKYYLHVEDDWEFNNQYDWIYLSKMIMEYDSTIIKVLARDVSPHPCLHDHPAPIDDIRWGYLEPWENKGIKWHGFSWNPGVTRLDLLEKFAPFPKYEQDLAEAIYKAGYKVAELSIPVYTHIGDGRSTHD